MLVILFRGKHFISIILLLPPFPMINISTVMYHVPSRWSFGNKTCFFFVLYCIVLYDTAETVYQSCQKDARVCKCSMDSYPETRPNPTRECSATSNEADTRATRQRLWGPATDTETTEEHVATWSRPTNSHTASTKLSRSHCSARLTPQQEATLTRSRKKAVIRGLEPISSVTASPTDGTICMMMSSLPRV